MKKLTNRVTVTSLTLIASALVVAMPTYANETDAVIRAAIVLAADDSNTNTPESSNSTPDMSNQSMSPPTDKQRPGATGSKSGEVNASRLISSHQQLKTGSSLRGGAILNKTVVSTNGDELGEVTEIAISPNGNISNVVLSVGGFLGMGDRLVVVPWEALEILPGTNKIRTSITKTDIAQAPLFDELSDRGLQLEIEEPISNTNISN